MPCVVFERLCERIEGRGIFVQRYDASKKPGKDLRTRIIAALCILFNEMSFGQFDELLQMSEGSARESLLEFVKEVLTLFGDEYLRQPIEADLRRILCVNQERGFPGCVRSW